MGKQFLFYYICTIILFIMDELIQYLQTLPFGQLMWIAGILTVITFLLTLGFIVFVFYRLFRKKRSPWDI